MWWCGPCGKYSSVAISFICHNLALMAYAAVLIDAHTNLPTKICTYMMPRNFADPQTKINIDTHICTNTKIHINMKMHSYMLKCADACRRADLQML